MEVPSSSRVLSQYARTLDSEAKLRYIEKISAFGGNDPYITLENGRPLVELSASELPDTAYHDIYIYLIESKSKEFTGKSLKAYKSLEAYKYFIAGHVQNVIITSAATPGIKLITAKVRNFHI
ncbi:hypothetical protein Pcinc_015870 [Petrolisthes cinctipes]|uniref:Uncharacterized protein n=1 Tax=Petrolisthes cinctipes TaxID=88211 RepID=A0AAE1FS63_PETCI|nr:hypothetical protein Pcinc_015870 [Petrolisthes cinctipes]